MVNQQGEVLVEGYMDHMNISRDELSLTPWLAPGHKEYIAPERTTRVHLEIVMHEMTMQELKELTDGKV